MSDDSENVKQADTKAPLVERLVMRNWLYVAKNQLWYKKPQLRLLSRKPSPLITRATLTVWWFAQGENPEINTMLKYYSGKAMHRNYGAYDA